MCLDTEEFSTALLIRFYQPPAFLPFRTAKTGPAVQVGLDKLGVKLTALSAAQANYLNLPRSGPFKPEHYRY